MSMNIYIADELAERVIGLSKALDNANKIIESLKKENIDLKLIILLDQNHLISRSGVCD